MFDEACRRQKIVVLGDIPLLSRTSSVSIFLHSSICVIVVLDLELSLASQLSYHIFGLSDCQSFEENPWFL